MPQANKFSFRTSYKADYSGRSRRTSLATSPKKIQNNMDKYGVNASISLIYAERLLLQPKVNFLMHCLRCKWVTGLLLPCKLGVCKAQSGVTY